MMNIDMGLQKILQAWRSQNAALDESGASDPGHLAGKTLYRMALAGGMKNAEPADVAHVSLCQTCLSRWAKLRQAVSDLDDSEAIEDERYLTWGMLEAAATDKPMEAMSLNSACGKFVLGVLPQMGKSNIGMITLEVFDAEAASEMEGRRATVRDAGGRLILQGRIRHARLARKIERLSDVNLAKWTVLVE